MAHMPVGPSGSGADMATAMSKSEAAPASPIPALVLDSSIEGVLRWHLRSWPEIAGFIESRVQALPISVVRQLADALGEYMELHAQAIVDPLVADRAHNLSALSLEVRTEVARAVLRRVRGVREELQERCRQLEIVLEEEHGFARSAKAVQEATHLFALLVVAMVASAKHHFVPDEVEDRMGRQS